MHMITSYTVLNIVIVLHYSAHRVLTVDQPGSASEEQNVTHNTDRKRGEGQFSLTWCSGVWGEVGERGESPATAAAICRYKETYFSRCSQTFLSQYFCSKNYSYTLSQAIWFTKDFQL